MSAVWYRGRPARKNTSNTHTQGMAPDNYAEILARNIRAARSRADIGQESLAARMRALGYDAWIRQTVGSTERGRRRPAAEEILALSLALETSIASLMAPKDEDKAIDLPSGESIAVEAVQFSAVGKILHGAVQWDGDKPVLAAADRAVSRVARASRGRLGGLPDPYRHRPAAYKADARLARQNAEARQAEAGQMGVTAAEREHLADGAR